MQLRKRQRERRHAHFFRSKCKIDDLCSGESSWYIRGLIEHKIIRARTADFIRPRRGERFKRLFFFFPDLSSRDWTETREQLPGPCYPNPKILLLAILLGARALDSTLSYEDKLHPWPGETTRRFPPPPPLPSSLASSPIPIISRQRFAGTAYPACSYRNSVTFVSTKKPPPNTFNPSSSSPPDRRRTSMIQFDVNREIRRHSERDREMELLCVSGQETR